MPRTVMLVALVLLIAAASSGGASAQIIDPAVHNLERLTPLQFGTDQNPASMEPGEYKLKVGKGYRLKIAASDLTEYAFNAFLLPQHLYSQDRGGRRRDQGADPRRDRVREGRRSRALLRCRAPGNIRVRPEGHDAARHHRQVRRRVSHRRLAAAH